MKEDGTHDQLAPVKLVLMNTDPKGSKLVSVDLTAATDRLPVELQADILERLGFPGKLWAKLLVRPYDYQGVSYTHSVGQMMGAYSSFAGLALANHILCHAAILRGGQTFVSGSGQYAVVGDDVAHRNPDIAKHYINLLEGLGVVVNPIKGFNGDIIEFAKRLYYRTGEELSPSGTKVALRSMRNPIFLVSLIKDMRNKAIFTENFQLVLSSLYKFYHVIFEKSEMASNKYIFGTIGPQSGFWNLSVDNLGIKPIEDLFREFLSKLDLDMVTVNKAFASRIIKKS